MKKLNLIIALTFFVKISFAQVGINATGASADPSAMLDVSSTSKGILIPRMSTAHRISIPTPAIGLMVYDNTTNSYWYYNGSSWSNLAGSTSFSLPFQQNVTNAGYAFDISNLGTGGALKGVSNNTTGAGVYGESTSGTGVLGYGGNVSSVAVSGYAIAGTGVKAYSFAGKALEVDGNLKISGGNTSPSDGAVLTSDASGNAKWEKNNISFCARGVANTSIPYITNRKIEFTTEDHDLQNNFVNYAGSTTANSSKFTAPISGVYSFSAKVYLSLSSSIYNIYAARIMLMKNGVDFAYINGVPDNSLSSSEMQLAINQSLHLNAGDSVWIEVYQVSDGSSSVECYNTLEAGDFSGHLLLAD